LLCRYADEKSEDAFAELMRLRAELEALKKSMPAAP
jgi:hypothetical protein